MLEECPFCLKCREASDGVYPIATATIVEFGRGYTTDLEDFDNGGAGRAINRHNESTPGLHTLNILHNSVCPIHCHPPFCGWTAARRPCNEKTLLEPQEGHFRA